MSKKSGIITVTMNPAIDLACTVPDFTPGAVNRVTTCQTDAAGKGVNIAGLLRKFNLPVTVTGFLGSENALVFEKLFKDKGMVDAFIRVPGETRTGIKVLDPKKQTTTDINFPGLSPQAGDIEKLISTVDRLAENSAMVVIGGSMPATVCASVMDKLVAVIKSRGAKAVADTSGSALDAAIKAVPWLIKPNNDELSDLVGRPLKNIKDLVREARHLNRTGIAQVVVSLGSRGALFISENEEFLARPPAIEAVSTVGAGDAMIGGLVAGTALGLSFRDRARLATALSAATVAQAGPSLEALGAARILEDKVLIEPINI
ncbi:1-phosphofructokinase [uncultured Desulfobacter sp.]|uniref:1-phosphofructokinase n=1 Tax=uncultured Desulfobacter sp. TaxID=240139 RepID=UPI002AA877A8|nr:1-phosphofructokinase [uncultured Desulfobacter sp.]